MAEEHGGEDGLLEAAKNDKDKLTKASVAARLKEIKGDADTADERKVLNDYLALAEKAAATGTKVTDAQEALLLKVAAQYGKLTEDEIKTLVVDDKWLATLAAAVQGELDRLATIPRRDQLTPRQRTPRAPIRRRSLDLRQRRADQIANACQPLPVSVLIGGQFGNRRQRRSGSVRLAAASKARFTPVSSA
jgi:type I restriction enzyme M protein